MGDEGSWGHGAAAPGGIHLCPGEGEGLVWFFRPVQSPVALALATLGLEEGGDPAVPTGTKPGVLVEQGMCEKSGLERGVSVVMVGVWPLLHLKMVDELINFHGNILFIVINAWQTQGFAVCGVCGPSQEPQE